MLRHTGCGKKVAPRIFCRFLRIGLEFQGESLHTYVYVSPIHHKYRTFRYSCTVLKLSTLQRCNTSNFSALKNVRAHTQEITWSKQQQQQKVRILQSLRMFIMSILSFETSLWSLWNLFYSFVDRSPRQAVPDHLQRFLEFDNRLPLWVTLVIASNVAPSYSITRSLESTGLW